MHAAHGRKAELLARTFGVDAPAGPACQGWMRLISLVRNPASIARYLAGIGEPTELPARSADRPRPALLGLHHPPPQGALLPRRLRHPERLLDPQTPRGPSLRR